jgi:hypothetical protein
MTYLAGNSAAKVTNISLTGSGSMRAVQAISGKVEFFLLSDQFRLKMSGLAEF